jgi:hypothetical protein
MVVYTENPKESIKHVKNCKLVSSKPKQAQPRNKSRENVLPAAGKESTGVISRARPSLNKESGGLLFRKQVHTHIRKQ